MASPYVYILFSWERSHFFVIYLYHNLPWNARLFIQKLLSFLNVSLSILFIPYPLRYVRLLPAWELLLQQSWAAAAFSESRKTLPRIRSKTAVAAKLFAFLCLIGFPPFLFCQSELLPLHGYIITEKGFFPGLSLKNLNILLQKFFHSLLVPLLELTKASHQL